MRLLSLLALGAVFLTGCSSVLDRYERARGYPSSARVDTRGGEDYYRICHNDRDTRTVRERDVRRHLDHGDRFGACRRSDRDDRRARRNRDRDRDRDDDRYERRDRDDDRYERRDDDRYESRDDRRYRERYRDVRDYPRSARVVERNRVRYRMCHNGRTRLVNEPAVRGHLGHGDRFGACRR